MELDIVVVVSAIELDEVPASPGRVLVVKLRFLTTTNKQAGVKKTRTFRVSESR